MDITKTCYLFLDFDGTVYVDNVIPEENRRALRSVQGYGHQLILNTGRSHGGLDLEQEHHKGVAWDGLVFGASDIFYRGKHIHEHFLSTETALKWVRYAMDRHIWLTLEIEHGRNPWFWFDRHEGDFTEDEWNMLEREVRDLLKDNRLTKLSLNRVAPGDEKGMGKVSLIRQNGYTEVFPEGRDKGAVWVDFCRIFGVPPEQCICFGDSLNDLAIFKICPNSICMEHSPQELKQHSTYCAKSKYGVAEGIRYLFGIDT